MKTLIIESLPPYKKITLNRPKSLNALNASVFEELSTVFKTKNSDIQGLLINGNGEKAFSAGADVKELKKMSADEVKDYLKLANSTIDAFEQFPKPTIAVLHGYVLGGGLELALAADFLIAEEGAIFGMPETKIGLIPGFNGVRRLKNRIGSQRAKELIFSGKTITAQEALLFKLVDVVVKKEFLESMSMEMLKKMSQHPASITLAKQSFYSENTSPLFLKAFKTWVKES